MNFRRWIIVLFVLLVAYLGYHWWLLSVYHADVEVSIHPVIEQYADMQKKYVDPLLQKNSTGAEGQTLQSLTSDFHAIESATGRAQIVQLMDLQKKAYTLFNASGSVLTTQTEFSLWRHEASQNSTTFQKIVAYNQKAKIFNSVLQKPLIRIIGIIRGMQVFPLIDVNGSIYHEAITI